MATISSPRSDHDGATRRRRTLEIPPPPGRRDVVVVEALKTLAKKRKKFIGKVEDAIEDNGITIEVTRLRDRLTKLALGDTERLLLSTPGVTERLFFKAIEEELDEYDTDRPADDMSTTVTAAGGVASGEAVDPTGTTDAGPAEGTALKASVEARSPKTPATRKPGTSKGKP